MDSRVREVSRAVSAYDRDLFAKREMNGVIHIYRRNPNSADPMQLVFCLSENWNLRSPSRDWGLEVICNRLRAMDLWKSETEIDRMEAAKQKAQESKDRELHNSVEAFLYDFRRQFAKATNDINTSTLAKVDSRAKRGA